MEILIEDCADVVEIRRVFIGGCVTGALAHPGPNILSIFPIKELKNFRYQEHFCFLFFKIATFYYEVLIKLKQFSLARACHNFFSLPPLDPCLVEIAHESMNNLSLFCVHWDIQCLVSMCSPWMTKPTRLLYVQILFISCLGWPWCLSYNLVATFSGLTFKVDI